MDYIKVEGHEGLVRDASTGAIINTSRSDYQTYILARNRAMQRENEISRQAEEINNLKQDVSEIKDLLLQILAQKDK